MYNKFITLTESDIIFDQQQTKNQTKHVTNFNRVEGAFH